jgi:hypothetical protein
LPCGEIEIKQFIIVAIIVIVVFGVRFLIFIGPFIVVVFA